MIRKIKDREAINGMGNKSNFSKENPVLEQYSF
jgi:hypothetical protein